MPTLDPKKPRRKTEPGRKQVEESLLADCSVSRSSETLKEDDQTLSARKSSLSLSLDSIHSIYQSIGSDLGLLEASCGRAEHMQEQDEPPKDLDENKTSDFLLKIKDVEDKLKHLKDQYIAVSATETAQPGPCKNSDEMSSLAASNLAVNCEARTINTVLEASPQQNISESRIHPDELRRGLISSQNTGTNAIKN